MSNLLPEKYRFHHEYCELLTKIIRYIVNNGYKYLEFNVVIPLEGQTREFESFLAEGDRTIEECLDWCDSHGFEPLVSEQYRRQTYARFVIDFCDFVSEALSCSSRGKPTVAISLLRKPLTDHLLYFEWMLVAPDDFANTLRLTDADRREKTRSRRSKDAGVVKEVMGLLPDLSLVDHDFIYKSRYDKSVEYGFAGYFDMAIHLLTSSRVIATEGTNFNFVFSGRAAIESQWDLIYFNLPKLLYYSLQVVNALFPQDSGSKDPCPERGSLLRCGGFWLHLSEIVPTLSGAPVQFEGGSPLEEILPSCYRCGQAIRFDVANWRLLRETPFVRCQNCNTATEIVEEVE